MLNIQTEYPLDIMPARLRTGYKTRKVYACWDGDDKIEVYRDKEESVWIGTIYLENSLFEYYWIKTAPKPDVRKYKLIIPVLNREYTNFKVIKVDWT